MTDTMQSSMAIARQRRLRPLSAYPSLLTVPAMLLLILAMGYPLLTVVVRSFAEPLVYGDSGYVLRNELLARPLPLGSGKGAIGNVQGFLYYDQGRFAVHSALPGEGTRHLAGWGIGARASLAHNVSARIEGGEQTRMDIPGATPEHRVHVSVSVAF